MSLSYPFSQGEGEEEETDELVSQVLDEIGINLGSQVRWAVWLWSPGGGSQLFDAPAA